MKKVIGVLAHVDAGKTTFCEQLLYHTNSIRKRGRVDHKDTFLDYDSMEKERGITIFSDQAILQYNENEYYLIDTPGHIDFAPEMERVLPVLDYAILLINGIEGIQGHTETLWQLLKDYQIPCFIFINKADREGFQKENIIQQIQKQFQAVPLDLENITLLEELGDINNIILKEGAIELLAEQDLELLEQYLEEGYQEEKQEEYKKNLKQQIKNKLCVPFLCGSALKDKGIDTFLRYFSYFISEEAVEVQEPFQGVVYKVRHDNQGKKVIFLKVQQGTLKVKEEFRSQKEGEEILEKVSEIRIYHGTKWKSVDRADKGMICGITGINSWKAGDIIGENARKIQYEIQPLLKTTVVCPSNISIYDLLGKMKILEMEEPMLQVKWHKQLNEIQIHIMGQIQLEIIKELAKQRFDINLEFTECQVEYKETIRSTVIGVGHYEPLRHYAEAVIRIKPLKRNTGIQYENTCLLETLERNYQHLILTHLKEKQHIGLLTGAPLTDVCYELVTGRAHLKHTEGGDFRQAVYRAVRQGLEQAEMILLEPWYSFYITAPDEYMGKLISEIQKRGGQLEPPILEEEKVVFKGRGSVSNFMEFSAELPALTGGRGTIRLHFYGYEECKNPEDIIMSSGYSKERDLENPSSSIFCSHGAGFEVKWDQVSTYQHCKY